MNLSPFEEAVLGWVSMDYEAVHTIRDDLSRHLGRQVPDEDVGAALLTLARSGFVNVYVYDVPSRQYRRVGIDEFSVDKLWFMASEKGIAEGNR